MAEFPKPLEHQDADSKDDQALQKEAHAYLGRSPALQVVSELVDTLRRLSPTWWTPEILRASHSASKRIAWFKQRPDLRQQITTTITGLTPKIARRKTPDFQAGLIDSALDEGDVTVRTFEEAFTSTDLAVYGAADDLWRLFRKSMPWEENTAVYQELIGGLLKVLIADKSTHEGMTRKPILGAWDVRTAIDSTVWHTRIPLEIRAAIDDARLKKEKSSPREAFHAVSDLAIAGPELIALHIPLKDLACIFDAAEKLMGIGPASPAAEVKVEAKVAAKVEEAKPAADSSANVSAARTKRPSQPPAKAATAAAQAVVVIPIPGGNAPSAPPPLPVPRGLMIPTPVPGDWGAEVTTSNGGKTNDGSVDLIVELDDPADSQNGIQVKT